MKQPFRKTGLNITRRSREALTGLTQKTKALFVVSPDPEYTESTDTLDKGTQRLAQTPFGRMLLRWSKGPKKRKKKRRVSVVNLIFLAFFAAMVALSLWGSHNSASAATTKKAAPAPAATTKKAASMADWPVTTDKCPDGSASTGGLCSPAAFNPIKCPQQKVANASSDACNPWGQYSLVPVAGNAATWETVTQNDQLCIYLSYNATYAHNADITARYGGTSTVINKNDVYNVTCNSNQSGEFFPCIQDEAGLASDWASGKAIDPNTSAPGGPVAPSPSGVLPGHLSTTYLADTLSQPNVVRLYSWTLGLGLILLVPSLILAGYHLLFSASTFRYAEAITIIPRITMAAAAVAICFSLIGSLINLSNGLSDAIVQMHGVAIYPAPEQIVNQTNAQTYLIGYTLAVGDPNTDITNGNQESTDGTINANEPATSYRGVVMPIGRWGCAGNDFASIVATEFWTNIVSNFIPFFGNMANLIAKVEGAIAIVHHLGEFIEAILSVGLVAQMVFRIFMINFYIVTGPLACGCWAFPGVGQKVFGQWLKGLCSLLFTQAAQLFVLTVTPLLIPDLGKIGLPIDNTGFLSAIFSALPAIIVLYMTLQVPKFIGTSATKAIGSAGTMASGATAAAAAAAYSIAG